MRRKTLFGLVLLALAAGMISGELAYRSEICRDAIGRLCGHGRLLALVNGRAIYQVDAQREIDADQYFAGQNTMPISTDDVLPRLIANEKLRQRSEEEKLSDAELQRQFNLAQFQFIDDKLWASRLRASGVSEKLLREEMRADLQSRKWIERHIMSALSVEDKVAREFYLAHPQNFAQQLRLRASHIFLAAPPATPPDVVQVKQKSIDALRARLHGGEQFEQLVWAASEDEATKPHGGDLGYFSDGRIPHDFFTAVSQLKIGNEPTVVRSILGFHLVRLTDIQPPRAMTFEEARPEIIPLLHNARRREAVTALSRQLSGSSTLRTGWF